MTGDELVTRTLKRLDEDTTTPVFYSVSEVFAALSRAQRMFVLLTLCLERTLPFTLTAATTHYRVLTTFPDFLLPLSVRVGGTGGARLKPSRLADLDALSPTWQATAGVPERYALLGFDHLSIYKQPAGSGTSLDFTYAKCPSDIVTGGTPEIPEEYHPSLIDAAIPILRMDEGGQEFMKSLKYFSRFTEDASKMANYVRARNLNQRYDHLPPELTKMDLSGLVKLATKPPEPALLNIPQAS